MKGHLVAIDIHVFLPIIFSLFCFQPLTRGIQTMSCLISFSDIFILTALSHALTGTSVFFFLRYIGANYCRLVQYTGDTLASMASQNILATVNPNTSINELRERHLGHVDMNLEIFRHQWFKSNPQNISKTSVNNLYRHILPLRRVGT